MNKSKFITISKTAKAPQFKELVNLKPLPLTSELSEFCTFMHPNCDKIAAENQCQVFTKDNHFIYKMYVGAIVRTDVQSGQKKMYKHGIN